MPVTIHENDGKYSISIGTGREKKYTFSSTNNGDAEAKKLSHKNKGKLVVLKKINAKGPATIVAKWLDGKRA